MGSKDEIVNKLLFTTSGDEYKDHINFCAYRTKLLAVARAKKLSLIHISEPTRPY